MDGHRTVLIMGAGASFASDYHLPTMAAFWPTPSGLADPLQRFLIWFGAAKTQPFNLEEVLAYLDLARHRSGTWGLPTTPAGTDPERCYAAVLDELRARLATPSDRPCASHVKLFQRLEPEDSVITLNYDLIADCALRSVELPPGGTDLPHNSRLAKVGPLVGDPHFWGGVPPSLLPRESETGFYLKLHGSLDWLRCTTPNCPNNHRLFAVGVERLSDGQGPGHPCRLCGSALEIFIVPPVAAKRIDDRSRLSFLWNLALRELRKAQQIAVIGLSLAPTDFELRWLLRAAIVDRNSPALVVANPSAENRNTLISLFGTASTAVREYRGLAELVEGRPLS